MNNDELNFKALLEWLDADPKRAAGLYEGFRVKLVKFFAWRGCRRAEEYADLTLDKVAKKLAAGGVIQTEDKFHYIHGVALNLLYDYFRTIESKVIPITGENVPPVEDPDEQVDDMEMMRKCLQFLSQPECDLITRYEIEKLFAEPSRRRAKAKSLGISVKNLYLKVHRIREKLRKCLKESLLTEEAG